MIYVAVVITVSLLTMSLLSQCRRGVRWGDSEVMGRGVCGCRSDWYCVCGARLVARENTELSCVGGRVEISVQSCKYLALY